VPPAAEHRVEQPAAGDDQAHERGEPIADGEPARDGRLAGRLRREEGDERQQRHDGEVLEQQDRDDALPLGVAWSPRSSRSCMTMAVEVSTKPIAGDEGDTAGEEAE
jgi:hypothetical protein